MHQLMGNSAAIVGRKKTSATVGSAEVTKSSTSPPSTSMKISENHEREGNKKYVHAEQ